MPAMAQRQALGGCRQWSPTAARDVAKVRYSGSRTGAGDSLLSSVFRHQISAGQQLDQLTRLLHLLLS